MIKHLPCRKSSLANPIKKFRRNFRRVAAGWLVHRSSAKLYYTCSNAVGINSLAYQQLSW